MSRIVRRGLETAHVSAITLAWAQDYKYESKAHPKQTHSAERFCCHNKANITVGLLPSLGATASN